MRSFVVSLRGSKRLDGTLRALRSYGLAPEVHLGIRGTDLPDSLVREMTLRHPWRSLFLRAITPGELGCSLSHYLLLRRIVREGIPSALVLEDDVRFSRDPSDVLRELEDWLAGKRNYLVNWGGQKDPRFRLPISRRVYTGKRAPFSLLEFPEMLWNTHCLILDRDYCLERLRKAFPVIYVFDVYGMLGMSANYYVVEEDHLTCDPDLVPEGNPSTIQPRPPSKLSRVFPRKTLARLHLERFRDRALRIAFGNSFWPLERSCDYLERLEALNRIGFADSLH